MERAITYTVYIFYGDEREELYVGCTKNLEQRNRNHRAASPWYQWVDESKTQTLVFTDPRVAGDVEIALIQILEPVGNRSARQRYAVAPVEYIDGQKLRAWRIRRHLAQREVAIQAGVTTTTVHRIERANSPSTVYPRTLRALAGVFEVDPDELSA